VAPAGAAGCAPLERQRPNASGQTPASPDQTRACEIDSGVDFEIQVFRGVEYPWAIEPLPDGNLLVTERPGRMRIVSASGEVGQPIVGLPRVDGGGQGGLLDVTLSPSFATDRTIFWSFSEPRPGGTATSVARGVLSEDMRSVDQVQVIFRSQPAHDGSAHFGSRLAFSPDGLLFVTTGERSDLTTRPLAQTLDNHLGKVMRIRPDGSVPEDNPFVNDQAALPEIWSYGHRNLQGAAIDPQGRLWTLEHGPQGGDELNLIRKGGNHGWPVVTYGEEYSGRPIAGAVTAREDVQQPVYYWDPVIAPSGAQWYTGDAFPEWRGSLFIGGMVATALVHLVFENDRVVGEEHLLANRGKRIRDVRQGPDGALYVVTDDQAGEIWKILPR
jgi:glucose/arabinose dehydrogenase